MEKPCLEKQKGERGTRVEGRGEEGEGGRQTDRQTDRLCDALSEDLSLALNSKSWESDVASKPHSLMLIPLSYTQLTLPTNSLV